MGGWNLCHLAWDVLAFVTPRYRLNYIAHCLLFLQLRVLDRVATPEKEREKERQSEFPDEQVSAESF